MAKKSHQSPTLGLLPRADFLPDRIKNLNTARTNRRWIIALSIGVLLLCAAAVIGTQVLLNIGKQALDAEDAKTQTILEEQARYSDVLALIEKSNRLRLAYIVTSEPEVDWKGLIALATDSVPAGGTITSIHLAAPSSVQSTIVTSPLNQIPVVVSMNVTVRTQQLTGVSNFLSNAKSWPGYVDSLVSGLTRFSGGYEATLSINFGSAVLAEPSDRDLSVLGVR